jgi:hypothetical protein
MIMEKNQVKFRSKGLKIAETALASLLLIAILGVASLVGCTQSVGGETAALPSMPRVSSTGPNDLATNVAVGGTVTAVFSRSMMAGTIVASNFTVTKSGVPVTGIVTYDVPNKTAIFAPLGNLSGNTAYTATITTGAKDVDGNAMAANNVWGFTTGPSDTTLPAVVSTNPAHLATGVAINSSIHAVFSEALDPATVVAANFTVGPGVTGTVSYDLPNRTATFAPTGNLAVNTTYTATLTTAMTDTAGNPFATNKVWTFTTTAAAGVGPLPVSLGTAGNYVILAESAITTVPDSVITGDIGLSPAAESYMTGFSQSDATGYATSPQVTGFLYAADMTAPTPSSMTTAISNMHTAYTDAAGRTLPDFLNLGAGTLNGNTLAPGLYNWGSTVNITGNITISGAANDVWIFQMSGNLIVGNGKSIILGGAAQAKNIFWQVAGQATLGTTSHFEGIILSQTAITLQTSATMNGRALAKTQVALQKSTVTRP